MTTTPVDFDTIKAGMRDTWMAGDFGEVARYIQHHADDFMERRNITAGMRVLDVACGTGNLAIPAARAGASVIGIDIADNLIEQARARAHEAGLTIDFRVGDAEALDLPDGEFDLVVSMYGAMFAPRPENAAAELVRVCRPGGTIAMANWVPDSFIGQMFKLVGKHAPPPEGVPSPALWGDEATVRVRLENGVSGVRTAVVPVSFEFPFPVTDVVEFHSQFFGPIQRAMERLSENGRKALWRDLEQHWRQNNEADDGTTRVTAHYLEVVATRAG